MKTELKPYQLGRRLGSGVKVRWQHDNEPDELGWIDLTVTGFQSPNKNRHQISGKELGFWIELDMSTKLVLRPKEHLTIPITHNGETFVPIEEFERLFKVNRHWYVWNELIRDAHVNELIGKMDYRIIQWLITHNFHIDEPQGTWINVDELDTNPYE